MKQCPDCQNGAIKRGRIDRGVQRYRCRSCNRTFLLSYSYKFYSTPDQKIISFLKEGLGTLSISRLLNISKNTVTKRILRIADKITPPKVIGGAVYEVDEMWSFIDNKK